MVSNYERRDAARTKYEEYESRIEPILKSKGFSTDRDFSFIAKHIESTETQREYVELCIELLEANIAMDNPKDGVRDVIPEKQRC
jgi:hypothetical protein